MSEQRIITASLEGMRVLVDGKQCELQEYDFVGDRWLHKDASPWPLGRERAKEWLAGWNKVDRLAALSALVESADSRTQSSSLAEGRALDRQNGVMP